jgi:hypothetical protein
MPQASVHPTNLSVTLRIDQALAAVSTGMSTVSKRRDRSIVSEFESGCLGWQKRWHRASVPSAPCLFWTTWVTATAMAPSGIYGLLAGTARLHLAASPPALVLDQVLRTVRNQDKCASQRQLLVPRSGCGGRSSRVGYARPTGASLSGAGCGYPPSVHGV